MRLPSRIFTATFLAGSLFGAAVTGVGAAVSGSSIFSDVPSGSYFDQAVGELYGDGVIKGNPDGTYRPGDPVSRAEIAVMLQRFKDSLDGTTVSRSSSSRSTSVSSSSSSSSATSIATNSKGIFRFTTSTFSVNENSASVTISVVRTGGNQGSVSVDYEIASNTATAGSDFEATTGTLSFASKETSRTFVVKILNDSSSEGLETATITLKNATNGADIASPATATININDDEASNSSSSNTSSAASSTNSNGTLSLAATVYGVYENAGNLTVTVERTGGTTGAVGVTYSTANGSATAGADYTTVNGTLSFAAGETTKTFTVPLIDDSNIYGAKTFTLKLTSPTGGAVLGTSAANVTIYDDENGPETGSGAFKLIKDEYEVTEGDKQVSITVQRVGGSRYSSGVQYQTISGSASAGEDFTSKTGTLSFAPGEMSKTITIPIVDDSTSEQNDYFYFNLQSPSNGATLITPSSTTITIYD